MTTLNAYGQVVDIQNEQSLTLSLFEAYNVVPDVEFHSLINQKRSDYLLSSQDLKPRKLMTYAQNIYDYRNDDENTPWLKKTRDQMQIEALSAQVQNLRSENKKMQSSVKSNG